MERRYNGESGIYADDLTQYDPMIMAMIDAQRPKTLDIGELGYLDAALLKVIDGCNLACDYCYEYLDFDGMKRLRRMQMSDVTLRQTADRIGDYLVYRKQQIGWSTDFQDVFTLSFHGGEPLLVDADFYDRNLPAMFEIIRQKSPDTRLYSAIQTNGTLLSKRPMQPADGKDRVRSAMTWAQILGNIPDEYNLAVTVSIDGPKIIQDRYRPLASLDGRNRHGSYDLAIAGIDALKQYDPKKLDGLMAVAHPTGKQEVTWHDVSVSHPAWIFDMMYQTGVAKGDILLPYGTYEAPPPLLPATDGSTPYGDYLVAFFNNFWRQEQRPDGSILDIRFFRSIINMMYGGQSFVETLGPNNGNEFTIRPDGSIEAVDSMRIVGDVVATNMNVYEHDLQQVATELRRRQLIGRKILPAACQDCQFGVRDICGGGHVTTRQSESQPGMVPSIYCRDLGKIILHVTQQVMKTHRETMHRLTLQGAFNGRESAMPRIDIDKFDVCETCTADGGCCYTKRNMPQVVEAIARRQMGQRLRPIPVEEPPAALHPEPVDGYGIWKARYAFQGYVEIIPTFRTHSPLAPN